MGFTVPGCPSPIKGFRAIGGVVVEDKYMGKNTYVADCGGFCGCYLFVEIIVHGIIVTFVASSSYLISS